jgi:uncharacterized Rmd1/YagE family protein
MATPEATTAPVAPPHEAEITVKAFYIGQRIDLTQLAAIFAPFPRSQHRDSLIVRLDRPLGSTATTATSSPLSYAAVTGYGSVVFFDVDTTSASEFLASARGCATKLLPQPCVDDLRVAINPGLPSWSSLAADTLSLRQLDGNSLRVVSSVLAQSVALNHFEGKVDTMLEVFSALNADLEATGGKLRVPRERLFKLVAENNNVLTDVIVRVGLLSRSDAAWASAHHFDIHAALREDFELDDRFENLHFKLDLIGKQLHFNLEIVQNRKSDNLEWCVCVCASGTGALPSNSLRTRCLYVCAGSSSASSRPR